MENNSYKLHDEHPLSDPNERIRLGMESSRGRDRSLGELAYRALGHGFEPGRQPRPNEEAAFIAALEAIIREKNEMQRQQLASRDPLKRSVA